MIAPMIAMPSEPPTWRDAFSTAEPTPALSTGTLARRGRRARRHRQRHADAADEERREEVPERRVQAEPREVEELDRDEHHARRHQPARADAVARLPGDRRDEDDQDRHRQERRARLDGRVAEDVLHVQRHEEEDPEHRERDEQDDEVRARVGRVPEELEREHRRALVPLEEDERHERDRGDRERAEDARRAPAVRVRLDQPVGEREEADRRTSRAREGRAARASRRATRR